MLQLATVYPANACNGLSGKVWTWPSFEAGDIEGSPERGFTGAGGPSLAGGPWDLQVSPLGLETTWSLHVVSYDGDYHWWWNGTAVAAGAHV